MTTAGKEPSRSLRGNTDKSLKLERKKTDLYLRRKRKNVENVTTENIREGRLTADRARDTKRAKVDADKSQYRLTAKERASAKLDDQSLALERERSDEAQALERAEEDRLREKERFQKRMIAEALLNTEREETDSHLLAERSRIDSDSKQSTISLNLTKAALVTRDQFLAVVSHDLKNPLSNISLSAGLLRRNIPENHPSTIAQTKHVDSIERSVANMDRMISDLLDVERMTNGKLGLRAVSWTVG